MRKLALLMSLVFVVSYLGTNVFAQARERQRTPSSSERRAVPRESRQPERRAVPRPSPQRPHVDPRRNWDRGLGFNLYFDFGYQRPYRRPYRRPYYGYSRYDNYRYYPRYTQRCVPNRWVIVGYDYYGYPVYDLVFGYCY